MYFQINRQAAFGAFALLFSSALHAAGFQLSEKSANGLGRAFAGEAALIENASVLAANPAAMSGFDRTATSLLVNYIEPDFSVSGTSTLSVATPSGSLPVHSIDASEDELGDGTLLPALYLIQPLNDRWAVGFGVFSNFGLSSDYSDDFNALEIADKSELTTVNINASVSYRVNDNFTLGMGVNAVYGDGEIGATTPAYFDDLPSLPVPAGAILSRLDGDDWGYGWNVGTLWQATPNTSLALTYRAKVELELEGEMQSDLVAEYNAAGSLPIDLPAFAEFAVDQRLTEQTSLQFSALWAQWSSFDSLEAKLESGEQVHLKEQNFNNTWKLALGVTHKVNKRWTVRAGYAYDEGAVDTPDRTLAIPDVDRQWFTLGSSYHASQRFSLDLGYAFLYGRTTDIVESSALGTTFDGRLDDANVQIVALQLNYLL